MKREGIAYAYEVFGKFLVLSEWLNNLQPTVNIVMIVKTPCKNGTKNILNNVYKLRTDLISLDLTWKRVKTHYIYMKV